jgi:hypothetical protein
MESLVDDILKGACCELCGQYFKDPESEGPQLPPFIYEHGHPVVCKECFRGLKSFDKQYYQQATEETFG